MLLHRLKTLRSIKRKGNSAIMAMVLLVTLLAMGVIVGAVSLRNQIVQEFGDAAVALDHLDQSFYYLIQIDGDMDGNFDHSCTAEYIDPAPTLMDPEAMDANDPSDGAPAGIVFVPLGPGDPQEAAVPRPVGSLP